MQRQKDRKLEYDEASNNVHALFPGIDVTPFGRTTDEGWSGTPEPTVVVPPEPMAVSPGGRRVPWRAFSAGCVAAAALVGGGISAGSGFLTRPSAGVRASRVVSRTGDLALAPVEPRMPAMLRIHSGTRPLQRGGAHRTRSSRGRRASVTQRPPSSSASTPVSYAPPPTPRNESPPAVGTSSYVAAGGAATTASTGSNTSSPRAGPTGPVSLIGAGTTPSG
jgi:hypothetical protein